MSSVTQNQSNVMRRQMYNILFFVLPLFMIVMETIISIIDTIDRYPFYVIGVPIYLFVLSKTLQERGLREDHWVYNKLSIDHEKLKFYISLFSLIIILVSSFLFLDQFVIRLTYLFRQTITTKIINYQQYITILTLMVSIWVKVFGHLPNDPDFPIKIPQVRTKNLMMTNIVLLFLFPAFFMKDKLFISKIVTSQNFEIYFGLETSIKLIQHQLLLVVAFSAVISIFLSELNEYFSENTRHKLIITLSVFFFLIYDAIAVSVSDNFVNKQGNPISLNMFTKIEIIIFEASTLILISAGLTLTTRVRKFGNFAHAEFVTVGLYVIVAIRSYTWFADFISFSIGNISLFGGNNIFGWMILTFIITGIAGIMGEVLVFGPLERRDAVPLTLMVGSIGLGLVIRQTIQEIFEGTDKGTVGPVYPNFFENIENFLNDIHTVEVTMLFVISFSIFYAFKYQTENFDRLLTLLVGILIGYGLGHILGLGFTTKKVPVIFVGDFKLNIMHVNTSSLDFDILSLVWIVAILTSILWGIKKKYDAKGIFVFMSLNVLISIAIALLVSTILHFMYPSDITLISINASLATKPYTIGLFDLKLVPIARNHIWSIAIMFIVVFGLRYIFTQTTLGISMRATADDPELAQISGINTQRVIYWTWFIAAGITGVGGLFRFESSNIIPNAGFSVLLLIFAVVILGGFDSFEGTLISAFIVATVQTFSIIINQELDVWETSSTDIDRLVFWTARSDWSQAIPFAIIIVVLLFKPRGIFGVVDPKSKL